MKLTRSEKAKLNRFIDAFESADEIQINNTVVAEFSIFEFDQKADCGQDIVVLKQINEIGEEIPTILTVDHLLAAEFEYNMITCLDQDNESVQIQFFTSMPFIV